VNTRFASRRRPWICFKLTFTVHKGIARCEGGGVCQANEKPIARIGVCLKIDRTSLTSIAATQGGIRKIRMFHCYWYSSSSTRLTCVVEGSISGLKSRAREFESTGQIETASSSANMRIFQRNFNQGNLYCADLGRFTNALSKRESLQMPEDKVRMSMKMRASGGWIKWIGGGELLGAERQRLALLHEV
jgi:hypothetical protein